MAAKYFVGTGNWNDTNRWATSSGGPGGTGVPALGDDVYFDTNSGNATVNVTVGTTTTGILSINFTGYTSTLTMSNNIHIALGGTVSIDSTNVNATVAAPLYLNNTATLTSGGGTWGGNVTLAGGATKTLTSDFRILGSTATGTGSAITLSGSSYKYYTNGLTLVASLIGNSTIVLTGGTWSANVVVSTNLHFDGNVTISGSVNWSPTVANGAATMKYVSGTVNAGTSTITTALTTTAGITTFDTAGMNLYNLTLTGTSVFMTINSQLNVTNTIACSVVTALTIGGTSNFNSTGTLSLTNTLAINATIDMTLGALSKPSVQLTINGFDVTVNGNLVVGTAAILGTGSVKLGGGGTWTAGSANGIIRTNLEFIGDYTVSGTVYWIPSVANGAATMKYSSGTITTAGSTLLVTPTTTSGITIFDTAGMTWGNINIALTSGSSTAATINSTLSATTMTISVGSNTGTHTFEGTSGFDVTGTLTLNTNNIYRIAFTVDCSCGGFNKTGTSSNLTTLNGFNLTINGDLVMGLGVLAGTTNLKLGSGGIWTAGGTGALIRNSIEFIGNYTIGSIALPTVYWYPTVANGAATLKYTAGTITTSGSTLNTALITTASIVNFDTNPIVWNNITFSGAGTVLPVLVSDLRCSGILTNGATGNFTPSGSGAIRITGSGNYVGTAGSIHTLNTDWYFSSFTFNSFALNTNRVFIDTLLTPAATDRVLGSAAGGTTEFVMLSGSIVGLGGTNSGWNVPVTIAPTTGNTVTASGGIRIGNNVARTLKFDTTGGGTFNAGTSAISFGNTASTLTIDLSGAGIINLNSCTISNSGTVVMTISVTAGSASFNAGTSTLNISSGGTILNTQGIYWFNITTAGHTHTLNSSLVSTGTFQMNAVSTFTNGNLYWDPQGTLILGTGAVGFTFTVPKNLTVQNLVLNSATDGSAMILNSNSINVTSNLTMSGSNTGSGTTQINLTGIGTWSNTGASATTAYLNNPVTINTSGTITLSATVAIANTLTYSAGTIDALTNSSIIYLNSATLVGFGANSSSYMNNLTTAGTATLTINTTQAYFLGTITGSTATSFSSSSTFGFSTNNLSLTGNVTFTLRSLTSYIVRGVLTLRGTSAVPTTIQPSTNNSSNRAVLTLNNGGSQTVSFVTANNIDSSGGQTIWNYKGVNTGTLNWGSLVTPNTISSTWVS